MLAQERLKELLHYDPDTGVFTWRVSKRGIKAGSIAGATDKHGYSIIGADKARYKAHRLAWLYVYGGFPCGEIDHEDRDKANNKIANLRDVEAIENRRNMPIPSHNTSGIVGVCWDAARGLWAARIQVNGRSINLGRFASKKEAAAARESAERQYDFHPSHGRG